MRALSEKKKGVGREGGSYDTNPSSPKSAPADMVGVYSCSIPSFEHWRIEG